MNVRVLPLMSRARHRLLAAALVLMVLPACQQQRLARLEAAQQQQARELLQLKQALAERDEDVAQLEACVDELEGTVYEADSAAVGEAPAVTQL